MKPLTLSLTGFRSYPSTITVDFTGKSLVAALGDTGAGKSSLLDALCFALFRKSSWDAKEPRQLIADGQPAMSVELGFLHGGQRWHVHRTMHATNPNSGRHHLKNLDTDEETDGALAVDNRIRAVLQMGYETFLRVGLLPQGKFDQLLTAQTKERTERLRELFGAETLESIQQVAARHSHTLQQLLGDAKAKRTPMPDNPEQTAAEAAEAAEAASARTERLKTAIEDITTLQREVAAARETAATATAAAQTLSARTVTGSDEALDALESVADDIAARRDALEGRTAHVETQESELTGKIAAADAEGEGRDSLTKAALILETLAARAEEHRSERDRLVALTDQLAGERDAIDAAEEELAERARRAEPLARQARDAAKVNNQISRCAETARASLTAASDAARRIAETADAQAAAAAGDESARRELEAALQGKAAADSDLAEAETHLEGIQLRDRAAVIAAELHPGDNCLVCRQPVPTGFVPASQSSTAEDLAAARTRLQDAKTLHGTAITRLAEAQATVTTAELAVLDRDRDHQQAQHKMEQITGQALSTFRELASLATDPGQGFDADAASTMLTAALAAPPMDGPAGLRPPSEPDTAPIADAVTAYQHHASTRLEELQAEEHRGAAEIKADRKALAQRAKSHQRDTEDMTKATKRHTLAVAKTAADLHALPPAIQAMLPDNAIELSADDATTAAAAVTTRQTEIQELSDQRDKARAAKTEILTSQRALDQEARAHVERPLNDLHGSLDAWAQAATQALEHLDPADRAETPTTPAEPGIAELRQYATALAATTSTAADKLTDRATTATHRADAAMGKLGEHAVALTDIDGFDPEADLTPSQALHPLIAAATRAESEAKDHRQKQQEAHDLIKPAADLDFAIAAGQARHDALDVLRRELVDAKFLGHLTTLRTHALLGVASELLGQMSDGRFGFADGFDIVSRSSGVVHPPNRLSGGEKFLASLALALALAELHSRSGPTLGSLFLDEGFAALDTTILESALEVLRTQAGGERLVMVISHLHAVAEAVDDVLLVKRTPAGSSAHWLTPQERDDLVHADLASGLQTLTQ